MGTYKSKSVLINFMVKIWLLEDRKIELINKKVMPLYFYLASIGDSIQAKKSLEDGSKFILVDGVPYSAIEVVNEVKRRIARGIVDTMFNKGVIYMEELILEIEEERARINSKTGEVSIINSFKEEKIEKTENLINKLLESTNDELIVDIKTINNVDEYIYSGGGSKIENFIASMLISSEDREGKVEFEAFVEKKAIHLDSPHPMSIHWLEEIDSEKLAKGILSAKYVQVLGNEFRYKSATKDNKLKVRIYEFMTEDININDIIEYAVQKQYEIEEALYAYFIEETKKIRGEKKHMSDVEGYAIKCIRTKDDEFISQQTFIEYLEEIKKLDISSFKNKKVLFLTGYDGGLELFSPKNFDGVTMLCSEGETLVNQVLRDFERRPEAYKDIIERLDDSNKMN